MTSTRTSLSFVDPLLAGRPVQLVAVDTLAMENRSPVTAVQQLFADTAPALVANIQHK